jgi:hypothetical protein
VVEEIFIFRRRIRGAHCYLNIASVLLIHSGALLLFVLSIIKDYDLFN